MPKIKNDVDPITKLTPRQEIFCRKYIEFLGNATAAVKASGYNCSTDSSFRSRGSQLLTEINIATRIEQLQRKALARTDVTTDKIVKELARVAFSSMGDFSEWGRDGVRLKNSVDLSRDDLASVEEVSEASCKDSTTVKIKLYSKLGALNTLAKILGMTPERVGNAPGEIFKLEAMTPEQIKAAEERLINGRYDDEIDASANSGQNDDYDD